MRYPLFYIILKVHRDKLYNETNESSNSIVVAASPHECLIHTINCMYRKLPPEDE